MILSFADKTTEAIFHGKRSPSFPTKYIAVTRRRLDSINAATSEADLRIPPGNRFEHLIGNRKGLCSIRINRQWRIEFYFSDGNAREVRISNHYAD
jgi:toxin HigB-1